jgi:hypothetical protein
MSDEGSIQLSGAFHPTTGTVEDWNHAYVRVEDYLRAHRIHNRLHSTRLILTVLQRAAMRHAANPSLDPTTLAAEETEAMMDRWFAEILDERDQPHERIAVDGRLALLLCDGPQRWPYAFLDDQRVPADFIEAMRTGALTAGPDMSVSSMVPRPIDLGPIPEAAGETLERFERLPMLRTFFLWLLFTGVLAGIFYATR